MRMGCMLNCNVQRVLTHEEQHMILTLDIGNSQLFGGLFIKDNIRLHFRRTSKERASSDEFGLFLKQVIRENGFDPNDVEDIVVSSVVPESNHSVSSACIKYFNIRPLMLQAGLKTGLNLRIKNPQEVGGDLIAGMVAAAHQFQNKPLIVVDFGTATTICVVSRKREYLGGVFVPGLRLSMEALEQQTSSLPTVEIKVPDVVLGRDTVENIQSGLYYSSLGMIKEVCDRLCDDTFKNDKDVMVIGTGGFSRLFESANIFDVIEPDLVLHGLYKIWQLNKT